MVPHLIIQHRDVGFNHLGISLIPNFGRMFCIDPISRIVTGLKVAIRYGHEVIEGENLFNRLDL